MSKDNQFIDGVLYACQEIYLSHGQDMMAKEIMRASGDGIEFLKAQKRTGYKTREMNRLIREAFKKD